MTLKKTYECWTSIGRSFPPLNVIGMLDFYKKILFALKENIIVIFTKDHPT